MTNDHQSLVSIRGKVIGVGFDDFLDYYLHRLNLETLSVDFHGDRISVVVRGHEDLVDMLSMACWLGPSAALVDDVIVGPAVPAPAL